MPTLKELYTIAVEAGIDADPRGRDGVEKMLARRKKEYEALSETKKKEYDQEDLWDPYIDSGILAGNPDGEVKKVMAGIDIDVGEVAIAGILNDRGASIDALVAHHPQATGYAALHEVMEMQSENLARYGVPINIGEGVMRDRIGEVARKISPRNHTQAVDAAKLLGLSFMATHTMADNMVFDFLEKLFIERSAETVGDVMSILKEIPEYQQAMKVKAGPMIFSGSESNKTGKIAPLEITGGTEGSHLIYEKLAHAGVGTIIGMHASEEHRKEAQKYHLNLVIAGHMSSDSIGMNLILDKFEAKGVEIVPVSGFIRVSRNK
ncbi:MAG TPA: NGG1p interacting factor NIF3 [Candidatus Paceibacterota bacterium]|nr:NGG1p interacting factor NIF3 [Candidatus Paceibacterota bacterium]